MHPGVLAPAQTALAATDLVKRYGAGDTAVYALDGVTVAFRPPSSPRSWGRPAPASPR